MMSGPPCQEYFQSDAIFVGTVRSIEVRKQPLDGLHESPYDGKLVHFTIERAARGVQSAEVDVWTGMGGGDCGYEFKVGEAYVVYAYRRKDGPLGTGICSRTRPIADAADDLAYFSALPAAGRRARVFGTIKHTEYDYAARRALQYGGVADVQVLVRGSRGVFSTVTDAEGRYAIDGIPPGTYEAEALPPTPFSTRYLTSRFEIKDPRACRLQDFSLHFAGRVSGVVLDATGRPAADVRVEIAPATAPDEVIIRESSRVKTDSNGQFELADIPPGAYVVGIGMTTEIDPAVVYARTMFPGPIEVGEGNRVEIGTLRLPQPSRRHDLKGVAVSADGAPIAGASVYLQGPRYQQATMPVKTGADGSFTLPAFEGQTYTVRGYVNVSANPFRQAEGAQVISISGDPPPIRLVLVVR